MCPALDEVVGPDVVRTLWPQADTRPVTPPETALPGLFLGNLQPLPPPYTLDALHVHGPAGVSQHGCDPAIAVAPILRGKRDDVRGQRLLVGPPVRRLPLGRSMLPQNATGKTFGDLELPSDVIDACSAAGGA